MAWLEVNCVVAVERYIEQQYNSSQYRPALLNTCLIMFHHILVHCITDIIIRLVIQTHVSQFQSISRFIMRTTLMSATLPKTRYIFIRTGQSMNEMFPLKYANSKKLHIFLQNIYQLNLKWQAVKASLYYVYSNILLLPSIHKI